MLNNVFYPDVAGVGTHTLTYVYTDPATGCTDTDATTMTVFSLPSVDATTAAGDTAFCEGDPAVLAGVPAGGVWTGDFVSGNIFHTADAGGGVHTVYYTFSDSNGCSAQDSLLMYVQPRPGVDLYAAGRGCCVGQPFVLHARYANAPGIRWFTYGDGRFSNAYDTVTTYLHGPNEGLAERFRVGTVPVDICPADTDTLTVIIYPFPVIDFEAQPTEGCPPLVVDFTDLTTIARGAVARYEWIWSDGRRAAMKNVRRVFDAPGVYDVTLIAGSEQGCADTLTRKEYIRVYPAPTALFSVDSGVTVGTPLRFRNASKGVVPSTGKSRWYFDDPLASNGGWDSGWDAEHIYHDTGRYHPVLWVWNEWQCVDSLMQTIVIKPKFVVFVPNAFSPDDRGPRANNIFRVVASGFSSFHLEVYDRWGKPVYASDDYATHGWDGTLDGRKMAREGVYMWVVKVTDKSGKEHKVSGMVMLLR